MAEVQRYLVLLNILVIALFSGETIGERWDKLGFGVWGVRGAIFPVSI